MRLLHERELINALPNAIFINSDGRFLITLDNDHTAGIMSDAIVIYDLVRKEHSNFAAADFLPADVVGNLPDSRRPTRGVMWHSAVDLCFNVAGTRFYPCANPEECLELGLPFTVVDLPSRTVKYEPVPKKQPDDLDSNPSEVKYDARGWMPSTETVQNDRTVLPKYLLEGVRPDVSIHDITLSRLYKLSDDHRSYVPVEVPKDVKEWWDANIQKGK